MWERTLMSGWCTTLTGWSRWWRRVLRRWATGCAARVTTLIASVAVHGSIARSGSGKGVLRIGRTCKKERTVTFIIDKNLLIKESFVYKQTKLQGKIKLYTCNIVHTRWWYGSSSLSSLLFRARLNLIDNGLRIHTPAIKVTLVCQKMFRIVFA